MHRELQQRIILQVAFNVACVEHIVSLFISVTSIIAVKIWYV